MRKFLLPLTTLVAALVSQDPASATYTPANDQRDSPLTDSQITGSQSFSIPAPAASLLLTKQAPTVQMAGHRSHRSHSSHRSHRSGR